MNVTRLKQLADLNNTCLEVFGAWAKRERNRKEAIDLARFKASLVANGVVIENKAFWDLFETLDKEGYGQLIKSDRGIPFRFTPAYNVKDLGALALGDTSHPVPTAPLKPKPAKKRNLKIVQAPAPQVQKTVVVYLVKGKQMTLELPGDITSADLNQLTAVITSLGKRHEEKSVAV